MGDLSEKYRALRSLLKSTDGLVVGYSGGCDSVLLAAVAGETLGDRALLGLVSFEAYPREEMAEALKTSDALGLKTIVVREKMLADMDFAANTPERCYFCKKRMFSRLFELGRLHSLKVVADGSNQDDLVENRPGRFAAREMGVISPLQEVGFTKNDVRSLSRQMSLPTWDKPPFACLATRIPYGTPVESAVLERIGKAERFLNKAGFHQVRVRHHGDTARIEVAPAEIERLASRETREIVVAELKKSGYLSIAMDLGGYKTGNTDTEMTHRQIFLTNQERSTKL